MKKLLILSLSALLFAACSHNEFSEKATDSKVSFAPYLGKMTKANEIGASHFAAGGSITEFPLCRFVENGADSETKLLKWSATEKKWLYDDAELAVDADNGMKFYAYWPSEAWAVFVAPADYASAPSLAVAVPDVANQQDLIVAQCDLAAGGDIATLQFRHILSQLNFAVKGFDGAQITIKNVKVYSVANTGTYTYGATPAWTNAAGTVSYAYPFNYDGTKYTNEFTTSGSSDTDLLYVLGDGGNQAVQGNSVSYVPYETDAPNALIVLPQAFATKGTGGYFTFEYSVEYNGSTLASNTVHSPVYFADLSPAEWQMSKRYLYLIDFSQLFNGDKTNITFNVLVDGWVNHDDNGAVDVTL